MSLCVSVSGSVCLHLPLPLLVPRSRSSSPQPPLLSPPPLADTGPLWRFRQALFPEIPHLRCALQARGTSIPLSWRFVRLGSSSLSGAVFIHLHCILHKRRTMVLAMRGIEGQRAIFYPKRILNSSTTRRSLRLRRLHTQWLHVAAGRAAECTLPLSRAPVGGFYSLSRLPYACMSQHAKPCAHLPPSRMRRFYGETLPAGPVDSYKPDMIKYLTIEQVRQTR